MQSGEMCTVREKEGAEKKVGGPASLDRGGRRFGHYEDSV